MTLTPAGLPLQPYAMRKLFLLTAAVALVHLLLLGAVTGHIGWLTGPSETVLPEPQPDSWRTRTIEAPHVSPILTPSQDATATVVNPIPVKKAAAPLPPKPSKDATKTPEAPAALEASAIATPTAGVSTTALPPPQPDKPPEPGPSTPTSLAAATAAQAAAEVQNAKKVVYAAPALLLYDGRGEEKGFKYSASGELWWQPEAQRYNARLELAAFGFRVRTWTSKGELTDGGLQPVRFGDKPRGAEKATHFQRDKGIISFSANNADVPLQPGAQDKLSALLQLSALFAGEPARYVAGTSIRFQAADAHRAEVWDFKVGASETLELPGGTLRGTRFTKEPTVEFDQRIEVWLAPDMQFLPVRIRITEANGAYADLLWRKTQKPD